MSSKLSDYDYALPAELIAQQPAASRTDSRLLVVDRKSGRIDHREFNDFPRYLSPGDVLVINETKVRPARLFGAKTTGAKVELLLLEEMSPDTWTALARPAKRLTTGSKIVFAGELEGQVIEEGKEGWRTIRFTAPANVAAAIESAAVPALPPYIHETPADIGRYQTVYAAKNGSVAAPTAGLHFTADFLNEIEKAGVKVARVTLHIGLDTFRPIAVEDLDDHVMHTEVFEVPDDAAALVREARSRGSRVAAVGTTSVRALESWARIPAGEPAGGRQTELFIRPGFRFETTDSLLTNFHLPKSTLLVMVSAFAGGDLIKKAYREAIDRRYRFFSFGDAMLIV